MSYQSLFTITPEAPNHGDAINALHRDVFGPGRFARTAFRVRENCPPEPGLCFVAEKDGVLTGSVRLTRVRMGDDVAFLLGPLCVAKVEQHQGIGKALVAAAVTHAHANFSLPVILVGDGPYYKPLGFEAAPRGVKMPGPVDYQRLLINWPDAVAREGRADWCGVMRCGCEV